MKPPYDAALVLGVELGANDAPTDELARRVTAAAEVYHRGACAKLVLCGGKQPGHRLAEADVMARMMTALGVSEEPESGKSIAGHDGQLPQCGKSDRREKPRAGGDERLSPAAR